MGNHDVASARVMLFHDALAVDTEARHVEPPHHDRVPTVTRQQRGFLDRPLLHAAEQRQEQQRKACCQDDAARQQFVT